MTPRPANTTKIADGEMATPPQDTRSNSQRSYCLSSWSCLIKQYNSIVAVIVAVIALPSYVRRRIKLEEVYAVYVHKLIKNIKAIIFEKKFRHLMIYHV